MRSKYKVGQIFSTKKGGDAVIYEYRKYDDVTVMFLDDCGAKTKTTITALLSGEVKNLCVKNVCGVGFLGVGRFLSRDLRGKTKEYQAWENMMYRCYGTHPENTNTSYEDCIVCEEWHNFQNFAEWYVQQSNYGEGFALDKDLLKVGNKVYSPESCCLLPQEVNNHIIFKRGKPEGLPKGVAKRGRSFTATVSYGGISKHLGTYPNAKNAFLSYKKAKEDFLQVLAQKNKCFIREDVFDALCNLEMTEDGWLTKDELAFKFYEDDISDIPEYYVNNYHLASLGVNND